MRCTGARVPDTREADARVPGANAALHPPPAIHFEMAQPRGHRGAGAPPAGLGFRHFYRCGCTGLGVGQGLGSRLVSAWMHWRGAPGSATRHDNSCTAPSSVTVRSSSGAMFAIASAAATAHTFSGKRAPSVCAVLGSRCAYSQRTCPAKARDMSRTCHTLLRDMSRASV